jgi:hypothetical protein
MRGAHLTFSTTVKDGNEHTEVLIAEATLDDEVGTMIDRLCRRHTSWPAKISCFHRRGNGRSSQSWDSNDMDRYAADLNACNAAALPTERTARRAEL